MSTFKIEKVPLAAITKDSYQRELDHKQVDKIADEFDLAQWDLPKVVEYESHRYRVVAGQHRVEAARRLLEGNAWPFDTPAGYIQVQLVGGIDSEDEPDLFLDDSLNKRAVSPYAKHIAALGGKKNPRHDRAHDIQNAADRYHIRIDAKARGKTSVVLGINSLNRLWDACPADLRTKVLDQTIRLASSWSPDDSYRFEAYLLGGLGFVVRDLLKSEGHTGRLERLIEKRTALSIATRAWAYAAHEQAIGHPRPSLTSALTYATVIQAMLPKSARRSPLTPPFESRFPVAVEIGAI